MLLLGLAHTPALRADERAPSSKIERRLVAAVEESRDRALALLQTTVDVNSGTLNFAGVRRVGRLFAAELEELGFSTRWVDGEPFQRAGHLGAARAGDGPHVLLIGHLDTVFEPDSPFQRYEKLGEREARGPGVTDMKGGNVVMIQALRALAEVGVLDDLRLTVVLTGDEERSGRPLARARAALIEPARSADFAIGFEDGDSDPTTAVIARRGSSSWQLTVSGVSSHSSQIFQEEIGAGAIYEASRILTEFYRRLASLPNLTFNPGVILGGSQVDFDAGQARGTAFGKNNVVAERAIVTGDIRAVSPEQHREAVAAMQAIVADSLPRTSAELTFSDGYPPMPPSEGNRLLLELYDAVSRDLGYGPVAAVDPRKAGAADVSFVAELVPQVIDGVGLMGRGGHTVGEVADLTTLPMQTARAAVLLYRLSRSAPRFRG